jgi:hypothetical protein
VTAGPGVTGHIAAIRRTDGSLQATYDGHPLYTYIGDNAPGQANGNNLNISGGLWLEVPIVGGYVARAASTDSRGGWVAAVTSPARRRASLVPATTRGSECTPSGRHVIP